MFRKTNISYPVIRLRISGGKNVSFSENFAYLLHECSQSHKCQAKNSEVLRSYFCLILLFLLFYCFLTNFLDCQLEWKKIISELVRVKRYLCA